MGNKISMYGIVEAIEKYIMECAYDYHKEEFIVDNDEHSRITKVALELLLGLAIDNINDLVKMTLDITSSERPVEPDDVVLAENILKRRQA